MAVGSVRAGLLLVVWSHIASLWPLYPLLAGVGLAQAMTLYEPAFAVVARCYGAEARRGITALTLWGGFAVIYGAANGVITIVRGIAVREMLTPTAYGAINSVLAIPAMIARAVSPLGIALLWAATGSYNSVLIATLIGSALVVVSFWFAASQTALNKRAKAAL